jgi:DNA-directed RNA polymerase specialized sigma24 family protein
LVFATARRYVPFVQDDFEDICQFLRIKVYRALLSYDAGKTRAVREDGRDPRDAYVFTCVKNGAKDLFKRGQRNEVFLEDLAPASSWDSSDARSGLSSRDRFENDNGMTSSHDEVYGEIEDDDVVVPNTLDDLERRIVCLLFAGYRQSEVARTLGLAKRDMERSMRSIRAKMDDWRPAAEVVVFVSDRPTVEVSDRQRPHLRLAA